MKKDNYLKKILALMLALILSVSQLSVVSYAQEDNFMEGFTSSDGLDVVADEGADSDLGDGSGFSDNINSSEISQNETSVEVSPTEEKKTEAHLTITPSDEKDNTYDIEATWQITGAQDTDTLLALAMDKNAYEALPDTAKADSENVCHIRAFDENGAEITLPMTLTPDENDSNLLRLVYTQSGNGTVQLSQTIGLEKCDEDYESRVYVQCWNGDGQWKTLDEKNVQWKKDDIVQKSELSEAPEVTETPELSGTPEVTETPALSEKSESTETSEITEIPESTEESDTMEQVESDFNGADNTDNYTDMGNTQDQIALYTAGIDLTNYLIGVNINQEGAAETFEVGLSYRISTSDLKKAGTTTLTYQLPIQINATKDFDDNILDNGVVVGNYHVDGKTGAVTLNFNEKYIQDGTTDTDIVGTLNLWAKLDKNHIKDEEKIDIDFGHECTATVNIKESTTAQYDVAVEKSSPSTYHIDKQSEPNTITFDYIIDISSNKGTNGEINVKDILQGQDNTKFSYENIQVIKLKGTQQDNTYVYNQELITGIDAETKAPTLSGILPGLNASESYRIIYSVKRTLADTDTTIAFNNNVKVSNKDVFGEKNYWKSESIYDLSVSKESKDAPVVSENKEKLSNTYVIKISTTKGSYGKIQLNDLMETSSGNQPNNDIKRSYRVSAIKKHSGEITTDVDLSSISVDNTTGQLKGELAELAAGEYYEITYTVDFENLPGDKSLPIQLKNTVTVHDGYNWKQGSDTDTVRLTDVSVEKKSDTPPVLDRENGSVSNTYQIKVSTEKGTAGDISLNDRVTISDSNGNLANVNHQYKIKTIKKYKVGDPNTVLATIDSHSLSIDAEGKLVGSLPKLEAGEYYLVDYDVEFTNMPSDVDISVIMNNTVNVNDGNNSGTASDYDRTEWMGKNYGDWIYKDGIYDKNNNKIIWKVTLNKNAYGNMNGMELRDELTIPSNDREQSFSNVRLYEREYNSEHTGYTTYGPYIINIPYTFVDGAEVQDEHNQSHTINTKNEFYVEYETLVKPEDLKGMLNKYKNRAYLGEREATKDVEVPKEICIEKKFEGSAVQEDGGYILKWKTELEIPENGLTKDSYYEDKISDDQWNELGSGNHSWFTVGLLNNIKVSNGNSVLKPAQDYKVLILSNNTYKELSEISEDTKITSFRIVLNRNLYRNADDKLLIEYESYVNDTSVSFNTGIYTEGNFSVRGKASGKGEDGNLLKKTNADGGTNITRPISALYDSVSGKYLLAYKLVINGSNSARGNITVTDELPAGTELVTTKWNANGIDFDASKQKCVKNGVYFRYYEYNEMRENKYTTTENDVLYLGVKENGSEYWNANHNINNMAEAGVEVTVTGNQLKVEIPESAYRGPFEVKAWKDGEYQTVAVRNDISLTMVLYYAVAISPEQFTKYEKEFINNCSLITSAGESGSDSVSNTVTSEVKQIAKHGEYKNNTLSYSVDINPQAVKLLENKESLLTVEDSLTYERNKWCQNHNKTHKAITQVALKPDSLQLYRVEKNSEGVETETLASSDEIKDLKLEELNQSGDKGNLKLTFKVPDGVYYRLKYSYMIVVDSEARSCEYLKLNVVNKATVNGLASKSDSSEDEESFASQGSSATATKNYTTVALYKRDNENQVKGLPGAIFQLEKFNGTDWSTLGKFTTDENGVVQIGEKINEEYRIGYNCAYRIREITAPDGYKILDGDKYFWIYSSLFKTRITPQDWESNSLYTQNMLNVINGCLFVYDEKQEEDKTEFEVTKVWKDSEGATIGGEQYVNVALYQSTSREDMKNGTQIGQIIQLSSTNDWHYIWKELTKYQDNNGTPYYYYVKEISPGDNWSTSYSNDEALAADGRNHSFTIINTWKRDTTSIGVRKEWKSSAGNSIEPGKDHVTVQLKRKYKIDDSSGTQNDRVTVTVRLNGKDYSGNGSGDVTEKYISVPRGAKVIVSAKSPYYNGFSGVTSYTPVPAEIAYDNSEQYFYGANNQYSGSVEKLSFRVYQNTVVNIGNASCVYAKDSFNVVEDVSAGSDSSQNGWVEDSNFNNGTSNLDNIRELSSTNNWQYEWESLAKISPAGSPYYYYVEETAVDGFDTTYSCTSTPEKSVTEGLIIVTNSKVDQQIDISVEKKWSNYGEAEFENYQVVVQLYKDETPEGNKVILNKDNSWHYSWKILEGYTYSVKEIKVLDEKDKEVNNFNTTYSTDNLTTSGTITVTNTKKSQGITLPGTGGKDGWIFYGVGISFWAVSLSWLGLTFKKRKKLLRLQKEGQEGIP